MFVCLFIYLLIDFFIYLFVDHNASEIQGWKRWCWSLLATVLVLLVVRGTLSGETCLHWLILQVTWFKRSKIDWFRRYARTSECATNYSKKCNRQKVFIENRLLGSFSNPLWLGDLSGLSGSLCGGSGIWCFRRDSPATGNTTTNSKQRRVATAASKGEGFGLVLRRFGYGFVK